MQILNEIVRHKREELNRLGLDRRIAEWEREVATMPAVRSLAASLRQSAGVSIIAEIKRRSPSAGWLAKNLVVESMVKTYTAAGAAAISVLTETGYFGGSPDDLVAARGATTLPILRKDFIIDQSQLWESRALGADAVLLIVAILSPEELSNLFRQARRIGLEVLVEVHNVDELEAALVVEPLIIGINNRNLKTFTVDLVTSEKLRGLLPDNVVCISESGIKNHGDLQRLGACGIDGALIGETLVTNENPGVKIRELLGLKND